MLSGYMRRLMWPTVLAHAVPAIAWGCITGSVWVACLVLVVGVVSFVPRTNVYLRGHRRSRLAVALLDVPYFVHWTAGLLALPFLVLVPVELAVRSALVFPKAAFIGAYGCGCALAAYGALVRRRLVQTQRVEVAIEGLDPAFDGYRIVHLSDMHISAWTPRGGCGGPARPTLLVAISRS